MKRPTRLMIVDDEKRFTEMLSLTLGEMGVGTVTAFSGKECLDKLAENDIDVVILDIKMPGMDGIETLKEIKKRFPLVEVIMLTGHGTIETSVKGMKLGAFDYLLKPPEFDELLSKVADARERKDAHEERIRLAENQELLRESRKGGRKPF
ncbi:MAG: response regulator [Deltaproteobacteria bacterium]|nr:response regulator [Deltaproteobacteria bacterium]